MNEPLPRPAAAGIADTSDLIRAVRKSWKLVVGVVLALVGLVLVLDLVVRVPKYQSEVRILISNTAIDVVPGQQQQDQERMIRNELEVGRSRSVLTAVEERFGDDPAVLVGLEDGRDVIVILATDPDPQRAADLATFYAETFIEVREESVVEEYLRGARVIQDRLEELDSDIAALGEPALLSPEARELDLLTAQKSLLLQRLDDLTLSSDLTQTGTARIISPAEVADEPASPRVTRDVVLVLAIGLVLGVGVVYGRESLRRALSARSELENMLGDTVVLSELPRERDDPELAIVRKPESHYSEQIRALRTSLLFVTAQRDGVVIQVSSPMPADGKSTTALNLAYAIAATGKTVALVDADFRHPSISRTLRLDMGDGGLSDQLGELGDLHIRMYTDKRFTGLSVIPAGHGGRQRAELLDSPQMRQVVERLRHHNDVVLVDSSPLVPVTDGAVLAQHVDHLIMVVGHTTPPARVAEAMRLVASLDLPLLGVVPNGRPASRRDRSKYGYGYGSAADDDGDTDDADDDTDDTDDGDTDDGATDGEGLPAPDGDEEPVPSADGDFVPTFSIRSLKVTMGPRRGSRGKNARASRRAAGGDGTGDRIDSDASHDEADSAG